MMPYNYVSLFIFQPNDLPVGESKVLKSPTISINGFMLICIFKSNSTISMKLDTPEFAAYMFGIAMC